MVSKEHFSGCLIGQCLGDALGFPVEGFPPEACAAHVERFRRLSARDVLPGRGPFPFGQYTDDSQLAREWMQSYAALGYFDPQNYAARIAAIFAEERIVGRGFATDQAARRLARGKRWEEAGMPPPHAGNGSAMRAGPVGLLFNDNPEQLIRVACDQGWITHQDKRCLAGAVAIAGAVALAVRPGEIRVASWARELSEWVRTIHERFAEELLKLTEWVHLPPQEAVKLISCCGPPDYADEWKWISPFVVPSVLWSLYSFLRAPEDYWETICTAIGAGGDADTTAAMAGAISGAHVGLERLPLDLAHRLTDQGSWGFSELVGLAHLCHALKAKGSARG